MVLVQQLVKQAKQKAEPFLFLFLHYYPHTSRDSVSPFCEILVFSSWTYFDNLGG